jgi:hypothetical protein
MALEAFKSLLSDYRGSVALRDKVQGGMVNGSLSGDDVFGQSSPDAKADEIYCIFDKLLQRFLLVRLKLRFRRTALFSAFGVPLIC